jgi:hypothetical protein
MARILFLDFWPPLKRRVYPACELHGLGARSDTHGLSRPPGIETEVRLGEFGLGGVASVLRMDSLIGAVLQIIRWPWVAERP